MKNLKTIFATIFLGVFSLCAVAQQDAGFTMYFFNPVYVNPAYAGSREAFSGTMVHRSQWVGMPGAPTTQSLSIHSRIPYSRVGLGLQVYNDESGPMKNTGINLTYAHHIELNEKTTLSVGFTGMVNSIRIGFDQINYDDDVDPAFDGNASSSWVPDLAAGVYLYRERFYAGLSASHLMQSKFGLTDAPGANLAKFHRQYYFTSGVVLPLTESLDFRPSVLVKFVNAAPAIADINGSFIFNKRLFLGAGYRMSKRINMEGTDNMLVGIAEVSILNTLRFGYSYDYFLNRTGSYNGGTHEFMVGWDISGVKTKMSSPKFF
jgi:type IX secretion system PorP/SprF family membrane protein